VPVSSQVQEGLVWVQVEEVVLVLEAQEKVAV
jgi:hypothetical protein